MGLDTGATIAFVVAGGSSGGGRTGGRFGVPDFVDLDLRFGLGSSIASELERKIGPSNGSSSIIDSFNRTENRVDEANTPAEASSVGQP